MRQRDVVVQRLLGKLHIVALVAHRSAQAARELVIHGARLPVPLTDVVPQAAALHKAAAALLALVLVRQGQVLP